ncbi:hypothetical protein HUT06_03215 [Actinomadura sp. NAK00032]|uniref:hypothetical protein n=1 Tax=Actinomadura sp. NAK00032 TaxID=2742128 RepID=UPI00159281EC|nr:hypothetical protein [Actinomadura sp. NAK00032]QKW33169.1 hypothetical protein HUT06_03215 [Actinomadura sp. NAK00032]
MPVRRSVADSAALLRSDAEAVEHAAARLRALIDRLRDDPATPPWFISIAEAHITAASTAATDLATAAAHLNTLSGAES